MKEIAFNCSHCDTRLKVDYSEAGLQAKCPSCNRIIVVPKSSEKGTFSKLRLRVQTIALICITLLWATIYEIFLTDDGVVYFKQNFLLFLFNVALFAIASFAIFGFISFIILGLARLLRRHKQLLDFEKVYIRTVLILGTLIVLGKKDEQRSEFQSETQLPKESKLDVQRSEQKATIEKLGESERYHSALDGFICYFPEEPSIMPAQSSGLVFRGYQASEILAEQGFILYSVSFSNNTDKISFAETTEEAKQVLLSTLEEFRKSHSSNSKREAFTHFGTFLDRYAIEYKIHFTYNTVECIGQGIFLLDKHRIIKISSSYPKDIERLGLTKYHEFKESFVLIDK